MHVSDLVKSLRYPGRFIVLGQQAGALVAVYGATGRSASSLARRYIKDEHDDVWAAGTDEKVHTEGNVELLEYRAVHWTQHGFVVANGRQIEGDWETCDPEPDAYLTPRITGVVENGNATLFISRSVGGQVERKHWLLKLEEGKGYYIATYDGIDQRPMGSFVGEPIAVELDFADAKAGAEAVFAALTPPAGEADYRVGVVGASLAEVGERQIAIYNKS